MTSANGTPGHARGGSARNYSAADMRHDVIVGHKLADGHMSVHAPGQPCRLCASNPATARTHLAATAGTSARARLWLRRLGSLAGPGIVAATATALACAVSGGRAIAATQLPGTPAAATVPHLGRRWVSPLRRADTRR